MKSITHENRRRFTILTIVSVLVVAILTTTLVLLLKKDTTAPTNTIEVGKRIDTTLGGRKLLNASVWDGSSKTIWSNGSGTEADPYLIESASNLAYLKDNVSSNSYYSGKYFLQTIDIDLQEKAWSGIPSFQGIFDGNGFSIVNIWLSNSSTSLSSLGFFQSVSGTAIVKNIGLFFTSKEINYYRSQKFGGLIGSCGEKVSVSNCSVDGINFVKSYSGATYAGGLIGYIGHSSGIYSEVSNCSATNILLNDRGVQYGGGLIGYSHTPIVNCYVENVTITTNTASTTYIGGIVGRVNANIDNCICSNSTLQGQYVGGIVGADDSSYNRAKTITNCYSNADIPLQDYDTMAGGILGEAKYLTAIENCAFEGSIKFVTGSSVARSCVGGIVANLPHNWSVIVKNNYFNGTIELSDSLTIYVGGLIGQMTYSSSMYYVSIIGNLVQGSVTYKTYVSPQYFGALWGNSSSYSVYISYAYNNIVIGEFDLGYVLTVFAAGGCYISESFGNDNKYIRSNMVSTNTHSMYDYGAMTDVQAKLESTYSTFKEPFSNYFYIHNKVNNGYPMLHVHYKYAQVTGFDGSGTEVDPYQIKTTADLQGMQAYYNEYDMIDEYWWKLVNNINISTDANGLTLNWTPIGYEEGVTSGFNGHFDGNNKTISGLSITEQYENVGLFGRLANNATITNLNVSGIISWDQGKYVGGVVGHMEDGATLTNCTFTGTINGYLNSGNYAIVGGLAGRYSTDAITGSANYETYVYGANSYNTFNRYTTTYNVN